MDAEICKCGHPQRRHVMLRARCAIDDCDCVRFEMAERWEIVTKAVELDEQLELARRENRRLRAANRVLIGQQVLPGDHKETMRQLEHARDALMRIASDPTSTRAQVQAIVLRTLESLGAR